MYITKLLNTSPKRTNVINDVWHRIEYKNEFTRVKNCLLLSYGAEHNAIECQLLAAHKCDTMHVSKPQVNGKCNRHTYINAYTYMCGYMCNRLPLYLLQFYAKAKHAQLSCCLHFCVCVCCVVHCCQHNNGYAAAIACAKLLLPRCCHISWPSLSTNTYTHTYP